MGREIRTTRDQFAILIKGLRTVYAKQDFLVNEDAIEIWYSLLNDIDYKSLSLAIQRWMQTSRWSPTPADIREMALKNSGAEPKDSGEAWEEARDAVRRYGLNRKEDALRSLDPDIARAVERFGWRDMCDMEEDQVMAHKAQFMRIYQQIADRSFEMAKLSENTRNYIEMAKNIGIEFKGD